jgi:hypothetical protein
MKQDNTQDKVSSHTPEIGWAYSPHYKNDAQGHIFSHTENRLIMNTVAAAATSQEKLNKDCELIVIAVNNYSRLKAENEKLMAALEGLSKEVSITGLKLNTKKHFSLLVAKAYADKLIHESKRT